MRDEWGQRSEATRSSTFLEPCAIRQGLKPTLVDYVSVFMRSRHTPAGVKKKSGSGPRFGCTLLSVPVNLKRKHLTHAIRNNAACCKTMRCD
jgi:hypothetical protein